MLGHLGSWKYFLYEVGNPGYNFYIRIIVYISTSQTS